MEALGTALDLDLTEVFSFISQHFKEFIGESIGTTKEPEESHTPEVGIFWNLFPFYFYWDPITSTILNIGIWPVWILSQPLIFAWNLLPNTAIAIPVIAVLASIMSVLIIIIVAILAALSAIAAAILIFLLIGMPVIFSLAAVLVTVGLVFFFVFGGIGSFAFFGVFGLVAWVVLGAGMGTVLGFLNILALGSIVLVWQLLGLVAFS